MIKSLFHSYYLTQRSVAEMTAQSQVIMALTRGSIYRWFHKIRRRGEDYLVRWYNFDENHSNRKQVELWKPRGNLLPFADDISEVSMEGVSISFSAIARYMFKAYPRHDPWSSAARFSNKPWFSSTLTPYLYGTTHQQGFCSSMCLTNFPRWQNTARISTGGI